MVHITGRLTKDAEEKHFEGNKSVVNFTIALNDWYKPKEGEARDIVEYVQCSYWLTPTIAKSLKKGSVVEAAGRLFATAYMNGNEPKGQINLLVQFVKVHHFAKEEGKPKAEGQAKKTANRGNRPRKPTPEAALDATATEQPVGDLPF